MSRRREVEVFHHAGIKLHLLAEDGLARRCEHHRSGMNTCARRAASLRVCEFDLPLQPLLTNRIPAFIVFSDVAVRIPGQMERIVRCLVET